MSHTPNFDKRITDILAAIKPGQRVCPLTKEEWELTQGEIDWCQKFHVPPSGLSHRARWVLLGGCTFNYEWWWNKHAKTDRRILTYIHPATGVKVLPDDEWHNEDFTNVGQTYDASRPFFDQMMDLRAHVPLAATLNIKEPQNSVALVSYGDTNSLFVLGCRSKNSLLCSDTLDMESSVECYSSKSVLNSVNVVHSQRIHNCRYVRECFDCASSAYLFDCRNCEYCFCATNKRGRKYVYFNQQLSKGEYTAKMKPINIACRDQLEKYEKDFHDLMAREGIWPENFNEKSRDCFGEYLTNCTGCERVFASLDCLPRNEWCAFMANAQNNFFVIGGGDSTDNYYGNSVHSCAKTLFCMNLTGCSSMEYCLNCENCEYCFGCIGLQRKKYCILNKPYEPDAYWQKLDEIKMSLLDHGYGEFFPASFATSYFPESVAGLLMDVKMQDGKKLGFPDFDPESAGAIGELEEQESHRTTDDIPNCIDDMKVDDWAGVPLFDKKAGRHFAFFKHELEYYKEHRMAPPNEHFVKRVGDLYRSSNAFVMEPVSCVACGKKMEAAINQVFKNRRHMCKEDYLKYLEKHG